ncbi:MarR family winged helix-turn-helix transcriptional regulator [Mycobacterium intracellulare]|uniref:MarR family winged helix-turn-helix transcriptional regulator n=1 Tax=Mycobacterium intracellulare TaxID=1767 RepID=UPI003347A45A
MANKRLKPLELHEQPGHLVRRLQQAHKLLWAERVLDDLTSPQFAVLNVLEQSPGIDQRSLAELVGMDRSTIAEIAQRLVSRGLVIKGKDAIDGRRNILHLSTEGTALLRQTLPAAARVSKELVEVLRVQDRREFLRILKLLVDAHSHRLSDISAS